MSTLQWPRTETGFAKWEPEVELHLPHAPTRHGAIGRPYTRHEPKLGPRGPYPHPQTKLGMKAWREAWFFAGSPRVASPIVMEVYVRCLRPESHLLKHDGGVSAQGKKQPWPSGFDCSNVVKLVEDALKGYAFGDDAEIIAVHASKRWVRKAEDAGTFVSIRTAAIPTDH